MATPAPNQRFATTCWSIIRDAGKSHGATDSEAQSAMHRLCATYWYPLYAYLRRRGYQTSDAQDITQAFIASLIQKEAVSRADEWALWSGKSRDGHSLPMFASMD